MKKNIIILAGVLLTLISCSLKEELNDSITKEASDNILGANQALISAYQQLRSFENFDNQYVLQEHPSDEMAGPTRGSDWDDNGTWRALHLHTWTPDNIRILGAWEQLYKGLAFAIDAQSFEGITAEQKAQAVFLQSLYTFYITDIFGQVAMRVPGESVNNLPSLTFKRTEAIDYSIGILEAQLANLPSGTASTAYIANKNAGNALLAKMYLNRAVYKATDADGKPQAGPYTFTSADMQKVIDYADAAMVGRTLQNNYFENFSPSNGEISNELIFTAKNTNTEGGDIFQLSFVTLHYNQTPSGYNGFVTLTDLYNKFEAQDTRRSKSVPGFTDQHGLKAGILEGPQVDQNGLPILKRDSPGQLVFSQDFSLTNSTEEKGMRVVKYLPDYGNLKRPSNDFVFLRLADVMLMKAEALFRKGNSTAEALIIVNTLRQKRGASNLLSLTLINILDERGRELYWEGHRRQDQIRFGTFNNPVQGRSTVTDRHVLIFPIPLAKLAANPNLFQNPGY
ncbi:MAG: RagB/SusD family nutrient uptake outer membrane protein [Bacteroidota bacterium]